MCQLCYTWVCSGNEGSDGTHTCQGAVGVREHRKGRVESAADGGQRRGYAGRGREAEPNGGSCFHTTICDHFASFQATVPRGGDG